MTDFNSADHPRVADGTFTEKTQSSPTITLERVPRASAADIQSFVDAEHSDHDARFGTLEFATQDDATWGSALASLNSESLWHADRLSRFVGADADAFRAAFAARAAREGLTTELPRLAVRESDDILLDSSDEQEPASKYVSERLTEFDHGHFTRADYAEVGEDGIAYGLQLNPEYLGEIVAGSRRDGESEDDYASRLQEVAPDYNSALTDFFREEYNADLLGDDSTWDVIEFFLPYEDGGPSKSTIEYMGDRAEHETKLLAALNEWTYGTTMQSKLAKRLGYRYELSTNADRQYGDGRWVKDED